MVMHTYLIVKRLIYTEFLEDSFLLLQTKVEYRETSKYINEFIYQIEKRIPVMFHFVFLLQNELRIHAQKIFI